MNIRRARWLTSGFGRYAVLPVFLAVAASLSLRAAWFALGDRVALEMTSAELRLNGYWGRKAVRWSEIRGFRLESNTGQPQLAVETSTGGDWGNGKIRLPLGLAGLSHVELARLFELLEERRTAAQQPSSRVDPDGVINRYLAGRAAGEVGATAAAVPMPAARHAFGRKQV